MPMEMGREMPDMSAMRATKSDPESDKSYPCLCLDTEEALDLPDSGKITLRYRVQRRSMSASEDSDGARENHCVTLDVLSIEDVEGDAKRQKTATEDFNDRFAAFAKARREKKSEDSED